MGSSGKSYETITKLKAAVFPRGSKKRNSNNDVKHDHGQDKRGPSTFVEGKTQNKIKPTKLGYKYSRDIKRIQNSDKIRCGWYTKYSKIDDYSKNEGNHSFVNFEITKDL